MYDVSLSPDGRYLAYVATESPSHSIWVQQIATSTNVRLLESRISGGFVSIPGSHQSPAVPRDLLLFFCGNHHDLLSCQPHTLQPRRRRRSNPLAVFSNATGEDETIYAT